MIERASAGEQFKTPPPPLAISFTKRLLKGAVRTDKEIDCGMYIVWLMPSNSTHLDFMFKTAQTEIDQKSSH